MWDAGGGVRGVRFPDIGGSGGDGCGKSGLLWEWGNE